MQVFDSHRGLAALARVDRQRLTDAVSSLVERYPAVPLSAPAAGLAMLRIRESVNGDAFNLGEIPLSTASVELSLGDGEVARGAAHVMADDQDLATMLAVADAALSRSLPGSEPLFELLAEGMQELQSEQDVRQSIADRSKVRFALLNEDGS